MVDFFKRIEAAVLISRVLELYGVKILLTHSACDFLQVLGTVGFASGFFDCLGDLDLELRSVLI